MKALNAVQRVVMLLLLIPVVAIILDTILRAFDAREGNAIVDAVRSTADRFILEPFTNVFPDQTYLQTAAVALAGYGVITLLVVALFRALRSLVASKPAPKAPPAPAKRPAPEKKAEADSPKTSETSETSKTSESTAGDSAETKKS